MKPTDQSHEAGGVADIQSATTAMQVVISKGVTSTASDAAHTLGTDCTGNGSTPAKLSKPTRQIVRPRGGAPSGNKNRVTHGLCGIGWPDGTEHDRRRVGQFTRALTIAVLDAGGTLDVPTVATIQTAARHERHARLCGRWLREAVELTIDQKRSLSLDVARASESRDRAIRELNIGSKAHADPWAAIDAIAASSQSDDAQNASASRTEPQEG
jgi:hypothetical protein